MGTNVIIYYVTPISNEMTTIQSYYDRILIRAKEYAENNFFTNESINTLLLNHSMSALEGRLEIDEVYSSLSTTLDESICKDIIITYAAMVWEISKTWTPSNMDISEKLKEFDFPVEFFSVLQKVRLAKFHCIQHCK